MNNVELVIAIGNEICDECGPDRDCGLEYDDCHRIESALFILDQYKQEIE